MDLAELKQLVQQGESERLEFKKAFDESAIGKTLCALLNSSGGSVLVGVQDNGKLVGMHVQDITQQKLGNIKNKLEPAANIVIEPIALADDDKQIMVIHTEPDTQAQPYVFEGRPYERHGSRTERMAQTRYKQLVKQQVIERYPNWDEQLAEGVTLDNLDGEELARTVQDGIYANRVSATVNPQNGQDVLKKLKLVKGEQLTNAAVVLFCHDMPPDYSQCLIRLARFRGTQKGEFIDSRQEYGHAFDLINQAEMFFQKHIQVASRFAQGSFQRVDEPEYPFDGLREPLVNAICHRDYTMKGGTIGVAIYDDRIEISSPGRLPSGLTVQGLRQPHESQPRNAHIADVFFRRGMIERFGIGTQQMINACRRMQNPEPEFIERENHFIVCFYSRLYQGTTLGSQEFTQRQQKILQLLTDNESMSFGEISSSLDEDLPRRTLQDELTRLRDYGLIYHEGKGPAARWFIKKTSVRFNELK